MSPVCDVFRTRDPYHAVTSAFYLQVEGMAEADLEEGGKEGGDSSTTKVLSGLLRKLGNVLRICHCEQCNV